MNDDDILAPVARLAVLTRPPTSMTRAERSRAFVILKFVSKLVENSLKGFRDPLLEDARSSGEAVISEGKPTGSKRLIVDGIKVYDKVSTNNEPDRQKMIDLLAAKGIAITEAYDPVQTYAYNPSKVDALVTRGFLTRAEVDALKATSHSLVVEGSPQLLSLLEESAREKGAASP